MAEKYSARERNLAATEVAAGTAIGGAAVSGRVPEIVNRWARRKRRAEYEDVKNRVALNERRKGSGSKNTDYSRGMGLDKEGNWTKLERLDPDTKADNIHPQTGEKMPGFKNVTPRKDAWNAAWNAHDRAKNTLESKTNVPFPESEWETHSSGPNKGKRKGSVVAKDPATNEPLRTKSGKVKMSVQPAKIGHFRRAAVIGVGLPVGMGLAWQGSRNLAHQGELKRGEVGKALTRGEVDGAVVGGSIGGALYQAPSFTEWGLRAKSDKSLKEHPKHKRIIEDWKKKYGVEGIQRGDPRWTDAYHNYPTKVPGGEMRRAMSYTHAGKSGLALTGAAIGSGALMGAMAVRTGKRRRLRRNT